MKLNNNRFWMPTLMTVMLGTTTGYASEKSFDEGRYYLKLGAMGATPLSSDYIYDSDPTTRCVYHISSEDPAYYTLNLHLPDGHQIIGLNYEFYDFDTTGYTGARIIRSDGSTTGNEVLVSTFSSGASMNYRSEYEEMLTPHTIDNSLNQYFLQFYGVAPTANVYNLLMCQARVVLEPSQ